MLMPGLAPGIGFFPHREAVEGGRAKRGGGGASTRRRNKKPAAGAAAAGFVCAAQPQARNAQ
jgi:hypothetical protein